MKLRSVEIKNFRSISDVMIDFTAYSAVGLVGVNEAGKSNILRAISLIGSPNAAHSNNVRMPRPDEPDVVEAYVRFNFELTETEIEGLVEELAQQTLASSSSFPIFLGKNGHRPFYEFAKSRRVGTLHLDLLSGDSDVWTEELDDEYAEVDPGWVRLQNSDAVVTLPWQPTAPVSLSGKTLLKVADIGQLEINGATPLTATSLDLVWHGLLSDHVMGNLPSSLLWTYDRENVLPAGVSLDEFKSNPSVCAPLKAIFEIAEVKDIGREIDLEARRGRQRLNNLLSKVAARASAHLKSIWKDYEPATIELQLDGTEIRISIRDDSLSFDFADRSDGFKRLITFLLLISAKMKTKELQNSLLLIDEPEASLHPAGVRNLRDELLRVSQKNTVVYATHSPYMIDAKAVGRHLIVRKVSEVTRCEVAEGERVFGEEVLLNCLGISTLDSLKSANVIFEGWRDMRMFEIYLDAQLHDIHSELRGCGLAFAQGVKDIRNIVPILMLANREIYVVSDHDSAALEARTAFKEGRLTGTWKTYRELENGASTATTAEDFVRIAHLQSVYRNLCERHGLDSELVEADFGRKPRLDVVRAKLIGAGITGDPLKHRLDEFKSVVFDSLTADHIEESYTAVISSLESLVLERQTREEIREPHLEVVAA